MDGISTVILSALCSGIIATCVTLWWQGKAYAKRRKIQIFTTLMSKRYDIISEESVSALNMIDIVFYKSKQVRAAWKTFNVAASAPDSSTKVEAINDTLLKLIEVIAEDIGYKEIKWNDIKEFYYPIGLSDRLKDEALLRRVQIDAGIAQIDEAKKRKDVETSQTTDRNQMATQVLIEAMRTPDGLPKLVEAARQLKMLTAESK